MALLIWNGAVDGDVENPLNWFIDGLNIPGLPTPADDVSISQSNIVSDTWPSSGMIEVANIVCADGYLNGDVTFIANTSAYFYSDELSGMIDIGATVVCDTITFENQYHNTGTLTGNVYFDDYSINYGLIVGYVSFSSYSANYGTIQGSADFYHNTFTDGSSISSSATFQDSAICYNATLSDSHFYSGTAAYYTTLGDSSSGLEVYFAYVVFGTNAHTSSSYMVSCNFGDDATVESGTIVSCNFGDRAQLLGNGFDLVGGTSSFGDGAFFDMSNFPINGYSYIELRGQATADLGALSPLSDYSTSVTYAYRGVTPNYFIGPNDPPANPAAVLEGNTNFRVDGQAKVRRPFFG